MILLQTILFYQALSALPEISVAQVLKGERANELVRVTGEVIEVFPDETDKRFLHFYLFDDAKLVDVASQSQQLTLERLHDLVGSSITVKGYVRPRSEGFRRHSKPFVEETDGIEVLNTSPNGPFGAPPLELSTNQSPTAILGLGRRNVTGTVLANWQGNIFLLATSLGPVKVVLTRSSIPPCAGDQVEVVGLVSTDTANVILKCALWRPCPDQRPSVNCEKNPIDMLPEALDAPHHTLTRFNAKLVRIRGKVSYASPETDYGGIILTDQSHHEIRIDSGNNPTIFSKIPVGAIIEVIGICFCEIDPETLDLPFTRFKEFRVITRNPGDVKILQQPPWWTPGRLFSVISLLSVVLVGILFWNKALRKVIVRRSRQLAAEELAHAEADLKFDERTRLAVELHDSLSQTLTGAAMEIQAATKLRGDAPHVMIEHLNAAALTLQSCRNELRNCLWDLRSQALDVPDMTTAIMRTLEPHVNESHLSVRFNVPRSRFSDNTAHAILRIVRELVLNAIRHGQATAVRVAGSLDGNTLLFSVSDDGGGFDPDHRPGVAQGHFGLQGIKERLRAFNGTLSIKSKSGSGTKVNIAIRMPAETDKL